MIPKPVQMVLLCLAVLFTTTIITESFIPTMQTLLHDSIAMVDDRNHYIDGKGHQQKIANPEPRVFPKVFHSFSAGLIIMIIGAPTWTLFLYYAKDLRIDSGWMMWYPLTAALYGAEIWLIDFMGWLAEQPIEFKGTIIVGLSCVWIAVIAVHFGWFCMVLPQPPQKTEPKPEEETPLKTVDI